MADENKCNMDCDNCSLEECPEVEEQVITLTDCETNESRDFVVIDDFEYKDKSYYVLVPLVEQEADDEYEEFTIAEVIEDENGESSILTMAEDDPMIDEIYDYYDSIYEAAFEDVDDEDSQK